MQFQEKMKPLGDGFKMGGVVGHQESILGCAKGEVFIEVRTPEGEIVDRIHLHNVVTRDSSLLLARLARDPLEPKHGFNMLAIGTGALGNGNIPNAPSRDQRRLMNEIIRKPFSEITFRDENGAASAIATRVVDYTMVVGQTEGVGPWNEMGILSTISDNTATIYNNPNFAGQGGEPYDTSVDVSKYDILVNYLTFPVINKPLNMILAITWRLTFGD